MRWVIHSYSYSYLTLHSMSSLDTNSLNQLYIKKEFYTNWDSSNVHITAFGMKLDKEQNQLDWLDIIISNDNKLQFYLE
jgi:hypothetical protein